MSTIGRILPPLFLLIAAATGRAPHAFAQGKPPAAEPAALPAPYPTVGSIEALDPAFETLVAKDAKLEKLATGFRWSEGPIWIKAGKGKGKGKRQGAGYLLFSDVPRNIVFKWEPAGTLASFMNPSGYNGDRTDLREGGANGLQVDAQGRLLLCQHGNRRIARLADLNDPAGPQEVIADRYHGKRFSSPNDLIVHRNGDLYLTDPPYGLPKGADDPDKELPFAGVFRVIGRGKHKGQVELVYDQLERPNGIALSPDQKTLYVANSHGPNPIWMAFDVAKSGATSNPRVFFDARTLADQTRKGGNDGLTVDKQGNLFATGPGGVIVLSPKGKHLGTILTGGPNANCKFGGDDGTTLYITAGDALLRLATRTKGLGW